MLLLVRILLLEQDKNLLSLLLKLEIQNNLGQIGAGVPDLVEKVDCLLVSLYSVN